MNDDYIVNLGYGKDRFIRIKLNPDNHYTRFDFPLSFEINFNAFNFNGMLKSKEESSPDNNNRLNMDRHSKII